MGRGHQWLEHHSGPATAGGTLRPTESPCGQHWGLLPGVSGNEMPGRKLDPVGQEGWGHRTVPLPRRAPRPSSPGNERQSPQRGVWLPAEVAVGAGWGAGCGYHLHPHSSLQLRGSTQWHPDAPRPPHLQATPQAPRVCAMPGPGTCCTHARAHVELTGPQRAPAAPRKPFSAFGVHLPPPHPTGSLQCPGGNLATAPQPAGLSQVLLSPEKDAAHP